MLTICKKLQTSTKGIWMKIKILKCLFIVVMWFICTSITPQVSAAVAYYISDVDQAKISTAVVISTVGKSKVIETNRGFRTVYDIDVEEVLYGDAPSKIPLIVYGGTIGSQTLEIDGNIELHFGDYCVLFLLKQHDKWYPTALSQSKLTIVEDATRGTIVKRDNHQKLLLHTEKGTVDYEHQQASDMTLQELRQKLKGL